MSACDKKLKIQVGIVKRMLKEVSNYEKEAKVNEARVQKMKDDGKDEYDIKKQQEVLQESYMMIPDSKNRLESAVEKFSDVYNELKEDPDLDKTLLSEAQQIYKQITQE